jgi:outer membrane protein assembly factor BamB
MKFGFFYKMIINRNKQPFMTVLFLLSLGLAKAFALPTPTFTPTLTPVNVLSWAQFHFNNDNTSFNQHLDNPFLVPKWQASLGQPNVTYSSPPVVLDLGLLGQPDDPAIGIQGTETTANTGILCVGTTQGKVLALRTLDGGQLWSYQTQGEVYSSPAFLREGKNSRIYFGSTDGLVRALDANGNIQWQYQTNGAIFSSPTEGMINQTTDAVIVGSNDGTLYCLPALWLTIPKMTFKKSPSA